MITLGEVLCKHNCRTGGDTLTTEQIQCEEANLGYWSGLACQRVYIMFL